MNALAHTILVGLTLWLSQIQPTAANPQAGKIDGARSTRSQCGCTKVASFPPSVTIMKFRLPLSPVK
jgi:hypothetical protein